MLGFEHLKKYRAKLKTAAQSAIPEKTVGRLSNDDVVAAYRWLLGREPESQAIIDGYSAETPARLVEDFATSPEFHRRWKTSPYYYFNSILDVEGIIRA